MILTHESGAAGADNHFHSDRDRIWLAVTSSDVRAALRFQSVLKRKGKEAMAADPWVWTSVKKSVISVFTSVSLCFSKLENVKKQTQSMTVLGNLENSFRFLLILFKQDKKWGITQN